MLNILWRLVSSGAALVLAYFAYSFVVVPFVEPQVSIEAPATAPARPTAADTETRYSRQSLFSDADWEQDEQRTKVLRTGGAELLFLDYQPLDDGRVEVKPLTVIFLTSSSRNEPSKKPRPIVMRAPNGAMLRFDRPMQLGQTDMGEFLGGRMRGDVHIYSPETIPGKGDDLNIQTSDIQMDQQKVFTPHDVQFRFGQHRGSGRNLAIHMNNLKKRSANSVGLNVNSVESLELVHVEKMYFDLGSRRWLPGRDSSVELGSNLPDHANESRPARKNPRPEKSTPLEVTCDGPFVFDFVQSTASFNDHVVVSRAREAGQPERLNCELFEIHFDKKHDRSSGNPAEVSAGPNDLMSGMDVERLVAIGEPVTVRSSYDMDAPRLEYEFAPQGEYGIFWATGAGKIVEFGEAGEQVFSARWKKELVAQPDGGMHAVSLHGGAKVKIKDDTKFNANELHFWVKETPKRLPPQGKTNSNFAPDKLLAIGKVDIESPQLTGKTERIDAWFEHHPNPIENNTETEQRAETTPIVNRAQSSPEKTNPMAQTERGDERDAFFNSEQTAADEQPHQTFDVVGNEIRLLLAQAGKKTRLKKAVIKGAVQLRETRTKKPDEIPIEVSGELLELEQNAQERAFVTITGKPANVKARGLTLTGQRINLDQRSNRLWIDSPGKMTLPPRRQTSRGRGRQLDSDTTITWNGRMQFDGQQANFFENVTASSSSSSDRGGVRQLKVNGERLQVMLTQRIQLSDDSENKKMDDAELHTLTFFDRVVIDSRELDQRQKVVSVEHLETRTLTIDDRKKELRADGPGWGTSTHFGKQQLAFGAKRPPSSRPPLQDSSDSLHYGKIDFQQGIFGDLEKSVFHFVGYVRGVYGPVRGWNDRIDPNSPASLGEKGMLLNTDRLVVAELPRTPYGEQMYEGQALGNTYLQGNGVNANAHRMSYDQSKDLMILEGDARQFAELRRRTSNGGTDRAAARKILYYPERKDVQVQEGEYLDLSFISSQGRPNTQLLRSAPSPPRQRFAPR